MTYYSLSHWVNSNNEKQPFKEYSVSEGEICWTKETNASFKPLIKPIATDIRVMKVSLLITGTKELQSSYGIVLEM